LNADAAASARHPPKRRYSRDALASSMKAATRGKT
jgi:hypothetical protein